MKVALAVGVAIFIIEPCLFFFTKGSQDLSNLHYCNKTECIYTVSAHYANCKSKRLVQIPPQCSSAVYLDIRKNDLRYLNGTMLTKFVKLKYLYLDGNQIRNITPRAFETCTSLQQVFLQNNPIIIIRGEAFAGLINLRQLYLNMAKLEEIQPHAFDDLYALERLYLSDNFIESLPYDVFHSLNNLQIITLANNRLKTLAHDTFQGLIHLEYLDIKHNLLTTLPSGLFSGMILLERLTISYNSVSNIEYGAINFKELKSLEILDMQNNSIHTMKNFSSDISRIPKLFFAGNPIYCDCHSENLQIWYQINKGSSRVNDSRADVICHGPPLLAGQHMSSITSNILPCETTVKPTTILKHHSTTHLTRNVGIILQVDGAEKDGKESAYFGQTEQPKSNKDNLVMYIALGILAVSIIVVLVILGFAYRRCKHTCGSQNTEPEKPKEPKETDPLNVKTHITVNPLNETNHHYERVTNGPPVPPHADHQNCRPSDNTYPDSGNEEDFPPDNTNENELPLKPLPSPSIHNALSSVPSSPPYIPHAVMPTQHPNLMCSESMPVKATMQTPPTCMHCASQGHSHPVIPQGTYPPSNPFATSSPTHQLMQDKSFPMQLQNQDLNNNIKNLTWQPPFQAELGHNQQLSTPMSNQPPIPDYCKHAFQPQPTNPFIIA